MKQILVYVDQGVSGMTLMHAVKSLQKEVDTSMHPIKRVDAAFLTTVPWEKETALLLIPGGRDVYYDAKLSELALSKIRSFVEEGGKFLGLCAGAYFASSEIEFEKGGHLEVCGKRSLGFFPGLARGPVFGRGKYSEDSEKGASAAKLLWKDKTCFTYFNGGCSFENFSAYPSVEVLCSYAQEGSAAVVSCRVGKGLALLSGAHVEVSAERLSPLRAPEIAEIHPQLQEGEEIRRLLFRHLLAKLAISLTPI